MLMPAMQRSDAVAGYFRTLVTSDLTTAAAGGGDGGDDDDGSEGLLPLPASWWDVEADVGLLAGLHRHGYNAFDEIRKDPELAAAFQVGEGREGGEDVTEEGGGRYLAQFDLAVLVCVCHCSNRSEG